MCQRRVVGSVAIAVGLMFVSSCSRDYQSSYGPLKLENQTPLPDITGVVGTPVRHDGMEFDLLSIRPFDQSPKAVPRLALVIRTDNYGRQWSRNPEVTLHCDESTDTGDWFQGSTWESKGLVPTGEVREGQLLLGFARKHDAPGYNVASCTNARIVATMAGVDLPQVVNYPVDDLVIRQAIRQPRGPELPLPPAAP